MLAHLEPCALSSRSTLPQISLLPSNSIRQWKKDIRGYFALNINLAPSATQCTTKHAKPNADPFPQKQIAPSQ
jgi:hypothetical protein